MKRSIVILVLFVASLGMATAVFAAGSSGGGSSSSSGSASNGSSGQSPVDIYNQGYIAWKKGNFKDAAGFFTMAINAKSDYAEAYNMLGYCTRKLGDLTKAIGYYETALKLKPNFPEAREYFGEAYLEQGNLTKAVQQYVWLVKARSKNADELLDKISDYVNSQS
jgi:tetratricopeptide (TPR) repeat protein